MPNIYGIKLDRAREMLRRANWLPQPDASKDSNAHFHDDPSSVAFYMAHGLPEAEGCGVGLTGNLCGFAYNGKVGKLEVTTNNMQPSRAPGGKWDWPTVLAYDVNCR
ncbi:MAG TPA: hypothetical protein VJM78_01270 [Rhizomicrobium sp.]|nr:hypothetical protein [Rhizomicrobium sp.]